MFDKFDSLHAQSAPATPASAALFGSVSTGNATSPATSHASWPVLWASLQAQAQALGLRATLAEQASSADNLDWQLHLPGHPVLACRITGLQAAGDELRWQASSGLLALHARARGRYQILGLPYLSLFAATLSLQGGLAAAYGRARGQAIQLASTNLAGVAQQALAQYLADLRCAPQLHPTHTEWHGPPFCSSEQHWFELETLDVGPWQTFCQALALPPRVADLSWRAFMLRYARASAPLPAELAQALAARPLQEIQDLAQRSGVAICLLQATAAEQASRQAALSKLANCPWQFTQGASNPPPQSHSAMPETPEMAGKLPLAGLTLIESCRRIQGPLAAQLLLQLGVRVIKIEAPGGDPLRAMPPMLAQTPPVSARFAALNQGKQGAQIDLKSHAGRQQVLELAAQADIFLHNWAPDKAAQMALDQADLAQHNPQLIYAYASGWGQHTPPGNLPGTDFMAQAYSGLALRVRHSEAGPPAPGGSLFTLLDLLGGVVAAQGICAALLYNLDAEKQQTARVLRSDTSLLSAASLLAACPDLPSSATVLHCSDAALVLDCHAAHLQRLSRALALPADTGLEQIRQTLASQALASCLPRLHEAGLPIGIVCQDLSELAHAPHQAIWSFA